MCSSNYLYTRKTETRYFKNTTDIGFVCYNSAYEYCYSTNILIIELYFIIFFLV